MFLLIDSGLLWTHLPFAVGKGKEAKIVMALANQNLGIYVYELIVKR